MQNSSSSEELSNSIQNSSKQNNNQSLKENACCSNLSEIVNAIFDENDPQIEHDTIRIILQYLSSHGYTTSTVVLQEEAGMVQNEHSTNYSIINNLKTKVFEGDWEAVETLLKENCNKENLQQFIYLIYRQTYLEFISRNEYQKAHHYLFKYIKPIESICEQYYPGEFKELCYLLTVKTISSSPYFIHWPGVQKSREILYDTICHGFQDHSIILEKPIPNNRLVTLLKQACCFQIIASNSMNSTSSMNNEMKLQPFYTSNPSLVEDYENYPIPSILHSQHTINHGSIKSIIVNMNNNLYFTAMNSVYSLNDQHVCTEIGKHEGTIWSLDLSANHQSLLTGGSDSTIKIWSVLDHTHVPTLLYSNHGDIYSIAAHPYKEHTIVNGTFDGTVQIWDYNQQKVIKEYQPHSRSVTSVRFNPAGNLVISGGKDCKVELWDLINICQVSTYSKNLKEITGIDISSCGNLVAIASRSNCHSLIDTRTNKIEMYFRGVINMQSNFLRVHFLGDNILYSGSENGDICIWDIRTQRLLTKLKSPCGCGYVLDCCYSREIGELYSGYRNGDIAIWGN